MTRRNHRIATALALPVMASVTLNLAACGKKEEPPPPPPPPREAPPPPPPRPVTLAPIAQRVGVDQRVSFAQQHAPTDAGFAEAIFRLANGFATQNADALYPLLSDTGDRILDQVSQQWFDLTIEAVRVVSMDPAAKAARNLSSATFVLAIQTEDGATVHAFRATKDGNQWIADPLPASLETKRLASDWDQGDYFAIGDIVPTDLEDEETLESEGLAPAAPAGTGGGGGGRSGEAGG